MSHMGEATKIRDVVSCMKHPLSPMDSFPSSYISKSISVINPNHLDILLKIDIPSTHDAFTLTTNSISRQIDTDHCSQADFTEELIFTI